MVQSEPSIAGTDDRYDRTSPYSSTPHCRIPVTLFFYGPERSWVHILYGGTHAFNKILEAIFCVSKLLSKVKSRDFSVTQTYRRPLCALFRSTIAIVIFFFPFYWSTKVRVIHFLLTEKKLIEYINYRKNCVD